MWRSRFSYPASTINVIRRFSEKCAYDTHRVESKWQEKWQYAVERASEHASKFYVLSMFPYPSGHLHMGHVRVYTISDTVAHYHRMRGKMVLHPMGWDSFGLPAENAAIDQGVNPTQWTTENIEVMRTQLSTLGCQFDWTREISTSSPAYYTWTQWLFLQLYKQGLAYKKMALVNWDPVDQTVLANEQVDSDGYSWRSGAKVEQKYLSQWFFRISFYAEALLAGLEDLEWPNKVKASQKSWIGKSEGAYFDFKVQGTDLTIRAFTTQPETIYGVSFLAVGLDHPLVGEIALLGRDITCQLEELRNCSTLSNKKRSDITGINLGITAVHPFTSQLVPVFVTNFVIGEYGTQAVMGVPAHDARDKILADKHGLPCIAVKNSSDGGEGILMNSGRFTGMAIIDGASAIVDHARHLGVGGCKTQYRIRDWLVSRQRYWGTPIPIVYCEKCGVVPVGEDQLPVELPTDVELCGRGPSPLVQAKHWIEASCGRPGCSARRETDTMDTFVDSSWYFLRFINPKETTRMFTEDVFKWMPVDVYVGGIEHAVLHLLYARFITHFLHSIGLLKTREPFQKLLTQGMVLGKTYREKSSGRYLTKEEQATYHNEKWHIDESWEKMSKSKYNGVNPQEVINQYGADTVRVFMLFKAPPEMFIQWDIRAIKGAHRWLNRVWSLTQDHIAACGSEMNCGSEALNKKLVSVQHEAIREVTNHLDRHMYNVAIAELMTFSNKLKNFRTELLGTLVYHHSLRALCVLLAPMAPHITSELWEKLSEAGEKLHIVKPVGDVLQEKWPLWDEELIIKGSRTVVLQVNGIKRGSFFVPSEVCEPSNHSHLQVEAVRVAVEQKIISNHASATKIFISPKGNVVNFLVNNNLV